METDAIHQAVMATNLLTVGQSSAVAMASAMLTQAHATGIMFAQATHQLGQSFQVSQATTCKTILELLAPPSMHQRLADAMADFAAQTSR
jgi:Killing trait